MNTVQNQRNFSRLATCFAVALTGMALTACVSVQETVPQDIQSQSTPLDVQNAGSLNAIFGTGNFEVGPYRVHQIDRESSTNQGFSIGPYAQSSSKKGFSFTLTSADRSWKGYCSQRAEGNVLKIFGTDTYSKKSFLQCAMQSGETKLDLELKDEMEGLYGTVAFNNTTYPLRQYSYGNRQYGVVPPAAGFRIDSPDDSAVNVAALELRYPGRFWINTKSKSSTVEQEAFSAALAALLIHMR